MKRILGIFALVAVSAGTTWASLSPISVADGPDGDDADWALPTISGIAEDGQTLTANPGTSSPPTYQWRRCNDAGVDCVDIVGANAQSYVLTGADIGYTLRIEVTTSTSSGESSRLSEPTAVVAPAPPRNTAAPKISGTARAGLILTATTGTWNGTQPISYTFLWRRCDLTKLNCKTISGANAQSYKLTDADVGSTIRVRAYATNVAGTAYKPSGATSPVKPPCPVFGAKQEAGILNFPDASELSGLASSRLNPGVLWAHNDSGDTERAFAMTESGAHLGTYVVSAKKQLDWEDMAVGPGPAAGVSYLYLGAVGANGGRNWIYVYRVPEPQVSSSQAPVTVPLSSVERLAMRYPATEEYNAEALMVDPENHDIYVVTKSSDGVSKVFRYPAADQDPAVTYRLKLVTTLFLSGPVTAADISPNGREIAIKGYGFSRMWQRLPGDTVDAALGATPCKIGHGSGETLGYSATGNSYFTISEGRFKPLYRFDRAPG
jgi:hypothetical protein